MNVNPKSNWTRSLIAGTALLATTMTGCAGRSAVKEANLLVREAATIEQTVKQTPPKDVVQILNDANKKQKVVFEEIKKNAGWVDKKILQPVQRTWTAAVNKFNRCDNKVVDKMLDKKPVTTGVLKEGAEAINYNQNCKDVGTDIVGTAGAFGAGCITGGAGAPPVWGAVTGAVVKPVIKGTSQNSQTYTLGKGAYDAATGAVAGYGGAKLTYKPKPHHTASKPATPSKPVTPETPAAPVVTPAAPVVTPAAPVVEAAAPVVAPAAAPVVAPATAAPVLAAPAMM